MKQTLRIFYGFIGLIMALDVNAAVVNRPTAANRSAAARVQNRAPTVQAPTATVQITEPAEEQVEEQIISVDNKSSMFADVISEMTIDSSDTSAADAINAQLAYYDTGASGGGGQQLTAAACDRDLRACMTTKCGAGFTKCANDNSVTWGSKLDACRAKTKCTPREYALLAPELASDRDMNLRTAYYDSVIECGKNYNTCMFQNCGNSLNGCLAKADENKAIAACASIAKSCREQDNGLASRFTNVFSELRSDALAQAKQDEQDLYALRDAMRNTCTGLGALFDDRTLDCVYTANFYATPVDGAETLVASKKLYAGDRFQCSADWFGVDVTTYLENALRTTREQASATAAAMGAGLGTAAGLISSGAIKNANEARKAKKSAKEECEEAGKKWEDNQCKDKTKEDLQKEKEKAEKDKIKKEKKECKGPNKEWEDNKCVDKQQGDASNPKPQPKAKQPASNQNTNLVICTLYETLVDCNKQTAHCRWDIPSNKCIQTNP